jgi:hypothetical protein
VKTLINKPNLNTNKFTVNAPPYISITPVQKISLNAEVIQHAEPRYN